MPAAADLDLDFAKYVAQKRGAADQRARDGVAYAYGGEYRVRKTLSAARPVTLAIEATVRLWKSVAKAELLGTAVKVTDQQFPRLYDISARCAKALGIATPVVYVAPAIGELNAHTLGTDEDSYIVVNAALVDHLSDDELMAVIGHECGHIHNNHVVYSTALYYLSVAASFYVRWIVQPAILALRAWSRRAEITCDRAGLICTRNLDVTTAAFVKLALGSQKLYKDFNLDEYLKQLDENQKGLGRFGEIFCSHPYLPKRIQALRLFARGKLYRQLVGQPTTPGDDTLEAEIIDQKVSELVSVF
jgi:Zn-dependent protease with chaperone function